MALGNNLELVLVEGKGVKEPTDIASNNHLHWGRNENLTCSDEQLVCTVKHALGLGGLLLCTGHSAGTTEI